MIDRNNMLLGVIILIAVHVLQTTALAEETLTLVTIKPNRNVVGELISRDSDTVKLKDLKTGKVLVFPTVDVESVEPADSESYVIKYAGIANYLAWRIRNHPSTRPQKGKIAAVDAGFMYVNLGADTGIKVGQAFEVFSVGDDILDPDTGEIIGNTKRRIAELKVVKIEKSISKLKRSDGIENPLEIGSEVVGKPRAIAVLPFSNAQGRETADSRRISEEITTSLIESKSINVVERRLLDKVLAENNIQQTRAFDNDSAVRIGKLLGADLVLAGSISLLNNRHAQYFSRLVDVENGKLLFAVTHEENPTAKSAGRVAVRESGLDSNRIVKLSRRVLIEAEDAAQMNAPMTVVIDKNASGGRYVRLPRGSQTRGSAVYRLDVPEAGTWFLYARVKAKNRGKISINIKFLANGKEVESGTCPTRTSDEFRWHPLNQLDPSNRKDTKSRFIKYPSRFKLPAGIVKLHLTIREPGSGIDAIYISSIPKFER